MFRIDNATAISPIPAVAAVGPNPNSYFYKGNPGTGTPATIVDDDWCNAVQEELCNAITGFGVTLDKTKRDQLSTILLGTTGFFRRRMSANTNFYVRTDGNNSNDGLANTAGGAFLTVNGAIAALAKLWDLNGFTPAVNIQAGTFAAFSMNFPLLGQQSPIIFNGLGATTIISSAGTAIVGGFGAEFRYQNMKVGSSGSSAVNANNGARLFQGAGVELTGCGVGSNALLSANIGGSIQTEQNYTISGGGGCHYSAESAGLIYGSAVTVTQSGVLNFNSAYAAASLAGQVNMTGITFSGGTITGVRYAASSNGVIYTNGGGASFFPGNSAGTTSTGGQYV
jgi:hypothetical protein